MPDATKKTNVYVTRQIPDAGLDLLRERCDKVDLNPHDRSLTRDELLSAVGGRDGVLCQLTDRIDAELMHAASGCRVFSDYAVGHNNVDVDEATRRGIAVCNTPGVLTETTADLAWALIMATCRRVVEGDALTRAGEFKGWGPMMFLGADVYGKVLGILGAGRIGAATAMRARGFGMTVLYAHPRRNQELEEELNARHVTIEELFSQSDIVSIHVPLRNETHHLVDERLLSMMKSTAFLVNTARGPVVDEKVLVRFLKEHRIAGAGLDVYEDEPALAPGLAELPNTVLTPHIGSATVETRTAMSLLAAQNLIDVLEGRRPRAIVNPSVLPA